MLEYATDFARGLDIMGTEVLMGVDLVESIFDDLSI